MVMSAMERNISPATMCILHSQVMGHVQSGTTSDSKAVMAGYSGLLSAPSDLSCLYPENGACAAVLGADLQSRFADRETSTVLPFGAPPPYGFKQEYQSASISKSITSLNLAGALDFPSDGLYSHSKDGLDCKHAALHTFLPPCAQTDRLDGSELCQKTFVMVDLPESNKSKFFIPTMAHNCSCSLECNSNRKRDFLEHLPINSGMATDKCKKETTVELSRGNITAGESTRLCPGRDDNNIREESKLSCPRKDLQSGFGIFPGTYFERLQSIFFTAGEVPFPCSYPPAEAEAFGPGGGNEVNLDFQSLSHEDTDDLEALLSSDDDLSSTGHSPSDDLTNTSRMLSNGHCRNGSRLNSGKKRTRGVDYCSDHDAESSTATSAFIRLEYLKDNRKDTCHTVSESMKSATSKKCRDAGSSDELAAFSVRFPDGLRSRNESTEHEAVCKKPLREKQGQAKRARKKKIRQTFQLLRSIIPGGDCMDSAFVLDGAIHYVKSLQVKVQRLEAKTPI